MFRTLADSDYHPIDRLAIVGPPNSGKTAALLTWPRPITIMSYPGEKGWQTIPRDAPGVASMIWQVDDVTKLSPHAMVREVEDTTWKILADPALVTFAGDGLHKLYVWYYKRRRLDIDGWDLVKGDAVANAQRLDLLAYGNAQGGAYADFMLYLTKVLQSRAPRVALTCWIEPEMDQPELRSKSPTHDFPALPGKLARHICGEIPIVCSEMSPPDPRGRVSVRWQLRPAGRVWGVGLKIPPDVAQRVPERMDADYAKLEALLKPQEAPKP